MSSETSIFKKRSSKRIVPKSPENLFLSLKDRNPNIEHLWSHQADILRGYHPKHINTRDIAIELPTGTGKTLIGLLIAEYRRIVNKERVLYLCPTRQLAYQVYEKSKEYGIKTNVFVGSKKEYPQKEFNQYLNSEAIAISTYSSLFNINPKFGDPNVIICDDAHGAEEYIADMWSLNIDRYHHTDLYFKVAEMFKEDLPIDFYASLHNDSDPRRKDNVEKVPTPNLIEKADHLRSTLEENTDGCNPPLIFSFLTLGNNLLACNLFISWSNILIRPWIPPTLTHPPFEKATQRIYMSATLGEGGELERITGIPRIERLPVPDGWDKQGSGRRYFVFPNYGYEFEECMKFASEQINKRDRTLILCPNKIAAEYIQYYLEKNGVSHEFLTSHDIENSLDNFILKEKSVLILTNRYDGIDLPGDACRQLIIFGSTGATNLQEKFLLSRLGLTSLLKDRMKTRFTQATGRCTRGATDYSVVIPIGSEIFEYCSKAENRGEMHPELQAEINYALDMAEDLTLDKLSESIEIFLNQDKDWNNAEESIREEREEIEITKDERIKTLDSIVKYEVNFQYFLWKKDYEKALENSREIVDRLSGPEFEGIRALWYYNTGSVAWALYKRSKDELFKEITKEFYTKAKGCSRTISWFSGLSSIINDSTDEKELILDSISGYMIENIQKTIIEYGIVGPNFDKTMDIIEKYILENDHKQFEIGITYLGKLLGFNANRPNDKGTPDSVWTISDKVIIVFEAKSEETENNVISLDNCREASGHYRWAEHNLAVHKDAKKICVLVSRKSRLDKDAIPHAKELFYIHIDEIREIFYKIKSILKKTRVISTTTNGDYIRTKILEELENSKLDPTSLIKRFESVPLLDLSD